MDTRLETNRHTLARRELLALSHPQGFIVECVKGELWITAEGTAGDMIVSAGQSLRLYGVQRLFVSALQASVFVARPCCGEAPMQRIAERCVASLLDRISRWRHAPLTSYPAAQLR